MNAGEDQHIPVLTDAVLEQLDIKPDAVYVDCTFGRGGHSRAILAALGPAGRLVVMDRDPQAYQAAQAFAARDARVTAVRGCFGDIGEISTVQGIHAEVAGMVADLGVSSPQLDAAERGFSFMRDGPLDMRMDPQAGSSAADWLAAADQKEITRVISRYGEDRAAGRIARAICIGRESKPLTSTLQLAQLIESVVPRKPGGKHPATLTFQALRIHINNELAELESFLGSALNVLAVGGRLCVISFHSLEDRLTKRFMRDNARVAPELASLPVVPESAEPRLRLCGRAIRAAAAETESNPRARSAVLRSAERLR